MKGRWESFGVNEELDLVTDRNLLEFAVLVYTRPGVDLDQG